MRSDSATYLLTGYRSIIRISFRNGIYFEYFIVKSMAWCGLVPLLQINMSPFYRLRKWGWGQLYAGIDGDGDSCMRGWMATGTILKLVAEIGVGMGIRVPGTVGDGYKYLSPCSSLIS